VPPGDNVAEGLRSSAEIIVIVGEIGPLPNDADRQRRKAPALADAHVDQGRLDARIGADHQDGVGVLDAGDGRVEQVGCPAVRRIERRAVLPAIGVPGPEALHEEPQRKNLLPGQEIADDGAHALRRDALHAARDDAERLLPRRGAQAPVLTNKGTIEPLQPQPVDHLACLVRDPLLVDGLVDARQDAHDLAAARIDADGGADRVHHVDRRRLRQLPRPVVEGLRLVRERPDRAQIGDVGLQLRAHRALEVGGDLHVLAAADGAEVLDPRHLGHEAHAPRAVNAAVH
jgi:hypothetical protein